MYYLNNNGSRWVTDDMRFALRMPDGTHTIRKADFYEALGNFATFNFRRKGLRYAGFANENDRIEGLPVVELAKCRQLSKCGAAFERATDLGRSFSEV